MSRIGKKPITVPDSVQLTYNNETLTVKGPKGVQTVPIAEGISFNNENGILTFVRANPLLEDWEQMLLMSLCNYNIIANSTFSWWGAYLNTNICKIVCYPDKWFMPEANKDTNDLFLDDWVQISSF